jgi:hypothetical protein
MTSPYAKAGVMMRQSTDPGSASIILDVVSGGGIEFMTRPTSGAATRFISGTTVTSPPWLKLERTGSTVKASVSTDGSAWTVLGNATLSGSALIGLAVTSHDSTTLNQAFLDQVSVSASTSGGGSLPVSWSHGDVGSVGAAGNASQTGGTFTVSGSGADIWGTADAFHYAYTPMSGDGAIDARVVSMDNTNQFAKSGVMVRDSLNPGSPHVILDVKPNGEVEFMTRATEGTSTSFIAGAQKSFPVSLKLQRRFSSPSSSTVVAFVLDNTTGVWQELGAAQLSLGSGASAGLAVTSHNNSMLNTGVFDTVHVATNLLIEGDFEGYAPPALGPPGWVSDNPFRKVPAASETNHPRSGSKNGVCAQTTFENCGIYQEVTAPADGNYVLTMYAIADRSGGLVGVAVNGTTVQSADVAVRTDYDTTPYTMRFTAPAGATIRVWMYSPSSPGFVAIDDVALGQDFGTP